MKLFCCKTELPPVFFTFKSLCIGYINKIHKLGVTASLLYLQIHHRNYRLQIAIQHNSKIVKRHCGTSKRKPVFPVKIMALK